MTSLKMAILVSENLKLKQRKGWARMARPPSFLIDSIILFDDFLKLYSVEK